MTSPRILTLAAYPTISFGLRAAIESDDHFIYVGNLSEWRLLPEWLAEREADALLADIDWTDDDLRDAGGWSVLPPGLLLAEDVDAAGLAVSGGFRGVLLREAGVDEIVAGLRVVAAGMAVLDRRVLALIQDRSASTAASSNEIEALSPRETEVLDLIARGYPNKAIALELGISEHTVKFHVGSILSKLNAASRSEAVATAIRYGMVAV